MASLSDAEILEQYKVARDSIVTAIAEGNDVVEYQVMSQRRRSTDPAQALRLVEQQIAYYESRVNRTATGRTRNYAQIHRR
jgi:hypothetical protein